MKNNSGSPPVRVSVMKSLWVATKGDRLRLVGACAAIAISVLLNVYSRYGIRDILAAILHYSEGGQLHNVGLILAAGLGDAFVSLALIRWHFTLGNRIAERLRNQLMDRLLSTSWEDLNKQRNVKRLSGLLGEQIATFSDKAVGLMFNFLLVALVLLIVLQQDPFSGIVAVLVVGFVGWRLTHTNRERGRKRGQMQRVYGEVIHLVTLATGPLSQIVRCSPAVREEVKVRFRRANDETAQAAINENLHRRRGSTLVQLVSLALPVFVLSVMGTRYIAARHPVIVPVLYWSIPPSGIDPSMMATILALMIWIRGAIAVLFTSLVETQAGLHDFETILTITQALPPSIDEPGATELPPSTSSTGATIEVVNVSFAYEDVETPQLRNVSMEIHPAETVVLVGRSGSGKSTLLKLLLRLLLPTEGQVQVNGRDLKTAIHDSWTRYFYFVPQSHECTFLSGKLGEILALARPSASEADKLAALRRVGLEGWDLNQEVSPEKLSGAEEARIASGGERVRVVLAMAYLSDAPIIFLDEPTANLDSQTQHLALDMLGEWKAAGKTIVMVAHRLETIGDEDTVFVLEEGRIVQRGRRADLERDEQGAFFTLLRAARRIEPSVILDATASLEEEQEPPAEEPESQKDLPGLLPQWVRRLMNRLRDAIPPRER